MKLEVKYNEGFKNPKKQVEAGQVRTDGEFVILVLNSNSDECGMFNTVILDVLSDVDYYKELVFSGLNEPNFSVTEEDILFEYPLVLDATLELRYRSKDNE